MFNFKKDMQVYIYANGILQKLEVNPDLSYSQTFSEGDFSQKTLHNQNALYKGAYIDSINTADFKFTVPVRSNNPFIGYAAYDTIVENYFDLYIVGTNTIDKLTKAVIETTTYNISMQEVLSVSYSGSASLLSKVDQLPIERVQQPIGHYLRVKGIQVLIDGVELDSIAAINYEQSNSIKWTENNTLHKSLYGQVAYKENYVLQERRNSGSITQFLTSENQPLGADYAVGVPIYIKVYLDNNAYLDFDITECTYTRRLSINDLITRVIDFRRSNL